jgi:hypothetical protein
LLRRSFIVQSGSIPPLCEVLSSPFKPKIIVLESLYQTLRVGLKMATVDGNNPFDLPIEECGGLDQIKALLQNHEAFVSGRVHDLIMRYFGAKDDANDDDLTPEFDDGSYTFVQHQNGSVQVGWKGGLST